jgi:hypothetical protein
MYYRNPDDIDLNRLAQAIRALLEPRPLTLSNRLVLSFGMTLAPVLVFFLALGIGRLVDGL